MDNLTDVIITGALFTLNSAQNAASTASSFLVINNHKSRHVSATHGHLWGSPIVKGNFT
jgi:hypothetical protein